MHEFQAARQDLEAVLYLDPAHRDAAQMLQALPVAAVDETGMEDDKYASQRQQAKVCPLGASLMCAGFLFIISATLFPDCEALADWVLEARVQARSHEELLPAVVPRIRAQAFAARPGIAKVIAMR